MQPIGRFELEYILMKKFELNCKDPVIMIHKTSLLHYYIQFKIDYRLRIMFISGNRS
jgi:hypothetical protein